MSEPALTFEDVVDRFGRRLRALATGILCRPDEADEICQEALLTYWKAPPRETDPGAVFTWLRRVVTNLSISRLRRRRDVALDAGDRTADNRPDPASPDPAHRAESRELAAACRELIGTLSDEKRAVLSLRVLEDLSYEEIAGVMGCSMGTVMSRLHRARRDLVAAMRQRGLLAGLESEVPDTLEAESADASRQEAGQAGRRTLRRKA